jgi:hypothetical protein
LIALLLFVGSNALTGFGQIVFDDSGTFRIFVEEREVGTEQFSVSQTGSGGGIQVIAAGKTNLRLPDGALDLSSRLQASGEKSIPVSYQVDVGGDAPQRIINTFGNGRARAKIVTATGEQLREYVASENFVLLDEGIAHHYFFIALRTHSGRVPVIVPRENHQVMVTVSSRGKETIKIGGKDASLIHLVVLPAGGEERHVWVDDRNRVYKVEIPARSYKAERTELPK